MNFSKISYKSTLGKILRLPLKVIPNGTVVPILQGRLKGKKWIVGSHLHGCWLGSYEYEKRKIFERELKGGWVFFDIGANVGFYTLLGSVLVGESGRVVAFEPGKRNLSLLDKHLALNHARNVTVVRVAVGDRIGEVSFAEEPDQLGGWFGQKNFGSAHISDKGQTRVGLVTLDALLERKEIPLPDLMKIDVEGAEMMVLTGAANLL